MAVSWNFVKHWTFLFKKIRKYTWYTAFYLRNYKTYYFAVWVYRELSLNGEPGTTVPLGVVETFSLKRKSYQESLDAAAHADNHSLNPSMYEQKAKKPAFEPLPSSDIRTKFASIFLAAYNDFDKDEFSLLLQQHCVPELIMSVESVGLKKFNPKGAKFFELRGQETVVSFWDCLCQSTPDHIFKIYNTKVKVLANDYTSIVCGFTFSGTRVFKVSGLDDNCNKRVIYSMERSSSVIVGTTGKYTSNNSSLLRTVLNNSAAAGILPHDGVGTITDSASPAGEGGACLAGFLGPGNISMYGAYSLGGLGGVDGAGGTVQTAGHSHSHGHSHIQSQSYANSPSCSTRSCSPATSHSGTQSSAVFPALNCAAGAGGGTIAAGKDAGTAAASIAAAAAGLPHMQVSMYPAPHRVIASVVPDAYQGTISDTDVPQEDLVNVPRHVPSSLRISGNSDAPSERTAIGTLTYYVNPSKKIYKIYFAHSLRA
jgi:hypothetical protein